MIEIRHRWTDAIVWSGDAESLRAAVIAAVAGDANLGGANLGGADLGDAGHPLVAKVSGDDVLLFAVPPLEAK